VSKTKFRRVLAVVFLSATSLWGQGNYFWPQGNVQFNYGFPFANQSWSASGSFIPSYPPTSGCGAWEVSNGDTTLLVALAFSIYEQDTTMAGDFLGVVLTDTGVIGPGSYSLNPFAALPKFIFWAQAIDTATLNSLIDANFDFTDLSQLPFTVSTGGEVQIQALADDSIQFAFSANLAGTDLVVISNGSAVFYGDLQSNWYASGSVAYSIGGATYEVNGDYNIMSSGEGVGGIHLETGTRNYLLWQAYTTITSDSVRLLTMGLTSDSPLIPGTYLITPDTSLPKTELLFFPALPMSAIPPLFGADSLVFPDTGQGYVYRAVSGTVVLEDMGATQIRGNFTGILVNSLGDSLILEGGNFDLQVLSPVAVEGHGREFKPTTFRLNTIYPNPFNSSFNVEMQIPVAGRYHWQMINLRGQRVLEGSVYAARPGAWRSRISLPANIASGWYQFQMKGPGGISAQRSVLFLK